uniref:Reverse transcriptase/retrotransposon-derived protein RNase H-like domain-containing protein n=1 Tax=Bubo bubo TaxID=30461 RepID=A0A8C0FQE0_BUBBB
LLPSAPEKKPFCALKAALLSAPALGLPDYLYCDEHKGTAKGVLLQTLGPHKRTVAYFSSPLGPVTPFCIRARVAAAEMAAETRTVVLGPPLSVRVPHGVKIL